MFYNIKRPIYQSNRITVNIYTFNNEYQTIWKQANTIIMRNKYLNNSNCRTQCSIFHNG